MDKSSSASTRLVTTIRWMARIIGALAIAVFLFFFVAESKGKIAIESDRILMIVSLLLTFIGLIIAWKWEGIGGALGLGGLIGFNILAPTAVAKRMIFTVTGLYGFPALLFVCCWWQTRKQIRRKAK